MPNVRPLLVVLLASCDSASAPTVAPTPAPPPSARLHDHLREPDGPVPGLPGFSVTRVASANHCGGTRLVTERPATVAPDLQLLANVFAIEFPADLDFDPSHPTTSAASMKRFETWLERMKAASQAAIDHYEALAAKAPLTSPDHTEALERIAQVRFRFASMLARAEIPRDVRSGEYADEKRAAFCEQMQTIALPVVERAEQTLRLAAI